MDEAQLLAGLPLGEVIRSRGRTISAGECALLTDLTWTIGPVYIDQEYAASTMFKSVVLPAPIMIAVIGGLWTQSEHGQRLVDAGFRVVSALGVQARYRHPFRFGDTVHVESEVIARPGVADAPRARHHRDRRPGSEPARRCNHRAAAHPTRRPYRTRQGGSYNRLSHSRISTCCSPDRPV